MAKAAGKCVRDTVQELVASDVIMDGKCIKRQRCVNRKKGPFFIRPNTNAHSSPPGIVGSQGVDGGPYSLGTPCSPSDSFSGVERMPIPFDGN